MRVTEFIDGLVNTIRQRMPKATIIVRNLIEHFPVMRLPKAKPVKWTRFARMRALSWWDIAAVAALFAWICALVYIQQFHWSFVGTDQIIHYFPAAQKVLEGQGYRAFEFDVFRGPGYPLALAVVTRLLHGDMFAAGKVIAVTSSTLFLLFAYLLLRRVFGPITALASVLLTMGVNTFAFVSCANSTDIPFACLAMASLYFTACHERPGRLAAILAGFLAGLALTVRWTGLFLPLFVFARMVLVPGHKLGLRSKIQTIVVYLLAFLVTSGPWLYVNYLLHGSPLYTRGAIALDPNILPPSASLLDPLLQALKQEPIGFGVRFVAKLFGSLPVVIQGLNSYPGRGSWVMASRFWVLISIGLLFLLMRIDRLKLWFLLISGIWWASLVPIHYEPRFYMLLIPTFSALAVFVVTSGVLPDVRLTIGKGKWAKVTPGYTLDRLVGSRLPGWLTMNPTGTSLTSLVLIGLLAATAFSTVKHFQRDYRWLSERDDYHHELARFVRRLQGPGLHRPIGTRAFSQARYWIPRELGTPVAPLPGQDYESVLPKLSYVLYDQIEDEDILYDGWDDPKLSALTDPLRAPANLEAVYYKPHPYRAILYRILEQSNPAGILSARASSALPQNPAAQAFDNDAQTWWSSALHASDNAFESITFDLGKLTPVNRVWLLPRQGGQAFPAGLRIDVSQDGKTWQPVIEAEELPEPIQQNPQIFSFSETMARLVRITATQLRWGEDEEGYLASLVEARIGLAVERPSELPVFSIAATDLFFDPLSNELIAEVHNQSSAPGQATVEFSKGWSAQDTEYLGTVESSIAEPRGVGFARLSPSEWSPLEPGHCRPIRATVKPLSYGDLDLDTYGVMLPQPQTVDNLVCSPKEAVIDDFDYLESPLARGWRVPSDQTATADVSTTYDRELDRRVMRVSSEAEDGFVVSRWMKVYGRPELTLWIKSASDFMIYVQVIDFDGEYYYVQYMPFTWGNYPEEFPEGRYIYYPLGSYLTNGRWHRLERDVYGDFSAKTGGEVDYIEALSVRAYDDLALADLRLDVRE